MVFKFCPDIKNLHFVVAWNRPFGLNVGWEIRGFRSLAVFRKKILSRLRGVAGLSTLSNSVSGLRSVVGRIPLLNSVFGLCGGVSLFILLKSVSFGLRFARACAR